MPLDSDVVKVVANVKLDVLQVEKTVEGSLVKLSDSISRLASSFERMEYPLKIFLYCAGASGFIYATSALIQSLRSNKPV